MTAIKNKTILITGGAAGIGKLMGQRCLKDGAAKLVIWDINETTLQSTAQAFEAEGYSVFTYKVDVSDLEQIQQAAQQTKAEAGNIDILINNAGVVVGKNFVDHTHRDIDFTIDINVSALMHITLEFLPDMIKKGTGHIVNISSASAYIGNPKMSVYASSKWAVLGWSESLRLELEALGKDLHVTTINPSYINTGMFDGVKMNPFIPLLEPDYAVNKIMKGIKNNSIFVRMPRMVRFLPFLKGIMPTRLFDLIAGQWFGVYKSMADFKGHQKPIQKKR